MKDKPFYITTTLPYVNAEPHLGHALEFVRADVIARYKKLLGYDVFFNTGTDEHGKKILEGAEKEGIPVQEYVDRNANRFKELSDVLGVTKDIHFIRTTEERHIKAAQDMWKRCFDNGYIYKKAYEAKYCVGCELYKTDSELVDDKCPIHPNRDIEIIEEENYFFKFKEIGGKLLKLYEDNPRLVIPDFRFNEIKAFVKRGLEDFSISRLKSKMVWGVPVPGDDEHVMYVWFDALTSYISTLGWPDGEDFEKYWVNGTTVQYCGKDNLRQQSAIWQAMLLASGLKPTDSVIINGFIISGGQKMSKSIGNVINPFEVIDFFKDYTKYPEEVLRFVLLHEIPSFEDGDITMDSIKTAYTAHLANGIGNLTSRIMKMATTHKVELSKEEKEISFYVGSADSLLDNFDTSKVIKDIWVEIKITDESIQKTEPFKKVKIKEKEEEAKRDIHEYLYHLLGLALKLEPFLPRTSSKIIECIKENKIPEKHIFERFS